MSQPSMADSPCKMACKSGITPNGVHYCEGCYRTLMEVARWGQLSDEEKTVIISNLQFRKLAIDAVKTAYR